MNAPETIDTGLAGAFQQPTAAPETGQPAVVTAAVTDPANPGNAPANVEQPAPPSPTIQIAEPPTPVVKTLEQAMAERGIAMPTEPVPAAAPPPEQPQVMIAGNVKLVATSERIEAIALTPEEQKVQAPQRFLSEKQLTRLELEMDAGRRRVQAHQEHFERTAQLRAKATPSEIGAQGTTTPVRRPGDYVESGRNQGGTVFPQGHIFARAQQTPPTEG